MTRRRWMLVAALTFCAGEARSQADFAIDASLVVLHVTVTDRHGKPARNLPESAFHVYEDGVPQRVTLFRHEDAPVAVGLVVDNSGSMKRKLPEVVAAADEFARSSNPDDRMFVVNFNEHVSLGLPAGEDFVSSPEQLKAAMLRIHAKGETALYDAVLVALDHVRKSSLQKKVLIVLSDGGDNASTHGFPEVLTAIQRSDVLVYTVGLFDVYDEDQNPDVLKQMAKESGGQAFFPKEIAQVTSVLQDVSRDIRSQYTLAYAPTNENRDGTYRIISVKLGDRWIARTREGYLAPGPGEKAK